MFTFTVCVSESGFVKQNQYVPYDFNKLCQGMRERNWTFTGVGRTFSLYVYQLIP